MEILGQPREFPEKRQMVVHARVTLVPSGSGAGDQIATLRAKISEME